MTITDTIIHEVETLLKANAINAGLRCSTPNYVHNHQFGCPKYLTNNPNLLNHLEIYHPFRAGSIERWHLFVTDGKIIIVELQTHYHDHASRPRHHVFDLSDPHCFANLIQYLTQQTQDFQLLDVFAPRRDGSDSLKVLNHWP